MGSLPEWLSNLWEKKPMQTTTNASADDNGGNNFLNGYDVLGAAASTANVHWKASQTVKERVCDFTRARLDERGYKDWRIVDVCRHRLVDGRAVFIVATQGATEVQLMPGLTMQCPVMGHCLIIENSDGGFAVVEDDEGGGE